MFKRTKVGAGVWLACSGTLVVGVVPAFAQVQLERVEITGSSIKRVESEGALPVQVITRQEIERSGATSTEQLLQQISAVSSMGGTFAATGSGASTYGNSTISLRGLDEDRTLVLVNGRRVAAFATGGGSAVNVNSIPLAAIERVEVLKDGASGIYGSDAVAGVVNFILTKDFRGVEVAGTYGTPTRKGGGKSSKASVVAGFGDLETDRYNVTLSLGAEKETALFGRQRNFAKNGTVLPYIVSGATGQGNIQGPWTPGTGSIAGGNWVQGTEGTPFDNPSGDSLGSPLAAANNCESVNMFLNPTPNSGGQQFCAFDSAPYVNLVPKRELTNISGNFVFKLTNNLQAFGDLLYSKSVVTQNIQPSPLRNSFLTSDEQFALQGVDPVLLLRPANPNYGTAAAYLNSIGQGALVGQTLAVTARVFDFGTRIQKDTATQNRIVAGVRGSVLEQDWEVALSSNKSKLHGEVPGGYFSQVAFARVVNDAASDYNPFSLNQSAAFKAALAGANAQYRGTTLDATSKNTMLDGKVTGEMFSLPAGPAAYATGFQLRKEGYKLSPSDALLSGDIAGLGGATKPIDRTRTVKALFAEFNVPIVKGFEATLAGRHDRYNDGAGKSTNYKTSLRWQPVPTFLVRGSLGSGFRAPTLEDLWEPQTLGTSAQFDDPGTGQVDLQVPETTGGNPALKPEKSRQGSVGLVFSPTQNFTASVDYFQIKIEDGIALPSVSEVVTRFRAGDPAYAGLVTLTPGNSVASVRTILTNTGTAIVKGVDVEAALRQDFAPGRLDVNFSGTYMYRFDQTSPGGSISHKVGTIVEPDGATPVLGADEGGVVLRWKHALSGTWTQGPWSTTLTQNFYLGYRDSNDLNDEPHTVPDTAIYDAQVAFTGIKNMKLSLGVRNLFDKDPPIFVGAGAFFQSGYDPSQYDPRGRFVYVSLAYKF